MLHRTARFVTLALLQLHQTTSRCLHALIILNAQTFFKRRWHEMSSIPDPVFYIVAAIPGIGQIIPIRRLALRPMLLHTLLPLVPMGVHVLALFTGWCGCHPAPD